MERAIRLVRMIGLLDRRAWTRGALAAECGVSGATIDRDLVTLPTVLAATGGELVRETRDGEVMWRVSGGGWRG